MWIELMIGLIAGVMLLLAGYLVRTKNIFVFLTGFGDTWEPFNKEKLGNRIGTLIIILGVLAILTAIFTVWVGAIAGKVSAVFALMLVILIILSLILDRFGL